MLQLDEEEEEEDLGSEDDSDTSEDDAEPNAQERGEGKKRLWNVIFL